MHCPHCQAEAPDGSSFCTSCGKRLADPNAAVGTLSGATLGKMLLRIRVVGLGFFTMQGAPNRQAWHDKMAGTFVVRKTQDPPEM
ncbi:MAG: zinc ribbon domain-containing protein [Planctomycetes bacterium]|nr:zinc ribbon domain-containing protein [Planctomycetota bacterium]